MTGPVRPSELEARYLGEPAPRHPAIAFVLALACPGLGLAYMGRLAPAIAVNLLFVALWSAFVWAWSALKFFPAWPLATLVAGWVVLSVMAAVDAWRAAKVRGPDYILRDGNHPLVYAAIFLFSFFLPLMGVQHVALRRVWQVVEMRGETMFPTLLDGDRLLIDRTAYRDGDPTAGEVVLLSSPGADGTLMVSRVIAVPGDEVLLSDDTWVNGAVVARAPASEELLTRMRSRVGESRAELEYFLEERSGGRYPVVYTRAPSWSEPRAWQLGEDEFLVLNDNRAESQDSRAFGPIHRGDVVGRPMFVAFSTAGDSASVGWERFGRRVQMGTE